MILIFSQSYGIHHKKENEIEMLTYVDYIAPGGAAFQAGMRAGEFLAFYIVLESGLQPVCVLCLRMVGKRFVSHDAAREQRTKSFLCVCAK